MTQIHSRFVLAGGIRTHYLEAGDGPVVVLLHGGEFGACGGLTWEFNIAELARHFRVVAPDWLGFGQTEKLFSFEDMRAKRIWHIARFLEALQIGEADFVGNSMGGTTLIEEACEQVPAWPIRKMVVVAGGGFMPENEMRRLLTGYDGSREWMEKIVQGLFLREEIRDSAEYVDRRHRLSLEHGAWECTSAVRYKAPFRQPSSRSAADYSKIRVPTLLVAGRLDNLRLPNYTDSIMEQIRHAERHIVEGAGHCPQIDKPDEFNRIVLDFLGRD